MIFINIQAPLFCTLMPSEINGCIARARIKGIVMLHRAVDLHKKIVVIEPEGAVTKDQLYEMFQFLTPIVHTHSIGSWLFHKRQYNGWSILLSLFFECSMQKRVCEQPCGTQTFKIAVVTDNCDSGMLAITADHRIVKLFSYDEMDAAKRWLSIGVCE